MPLERFCRKKIVTVSPEATVFDVASKMREFHVGAVVVTRDAVPVGILTDRDITLRVVAERKDPSRVAAHEVMSPDVVSIRTDDGIDDAVGCIHANGVRRLPIVGPDGRLAGLLSLDDLIVLFGAELGEVVTAVRSNRGP